MSTFWVNGIVSHRDKKPYLQLSNEKGIIAQLSMNEAKQIAMDMLIMSARTEMDAMIHDFMIKMEFKDPKKAEEMAAYMMMSFREYRAGLDDEKIDHTHRGELLE